MQLKLELNTFLTLDYLIWNQSLTAANIIKFKLDQISFKK